MELFSFSLVLVIKTKILEGAQATTQTTTTSKATEEAIDLDSFGKTTALQFFYISLPSPHDCDVKMPNFTFLKDENTIKTTTFFFFSSIQSS